MTIITDDHNVETFAFEDSLPKLPLPDLHKTLSHLKKSLEPLYYADGYYKHPLDPKNIKNLTDIINYFEKSTVSKKLQSKLISFNEKNISYLDNLHLDINNHSSTTDIQDDILPRNPFLILCDDAIPNISQSDRSAVLVHSALRFISAFKRKILPPEMNSKTGNHFSMYPYKNLFGTTRSPIFQNGEIEKFNLNKPYTISDLENDVNNDESDTEDFDINLKEKSIDSNSTNNDDDDENDIFKRHGITISRYPESKHILIISRGQYYIIDVLDEENNILFTSNELITFFNYIINDSEKIYNFEKSTALGSLTSHSFKNWKYARKRLQKRYPEELHLIDSALFVLVLDESDESNNNNNSNSEIKNSTLYDNDHKPINKNINQESSINCKRLFYGTSVINSKGHQVGSCISRWYDKLQLVVTTDSKAAVIWDSFTCDGSAVLRFTSEIYTESILRLAKEVNAGDSQFSLWPKVKQSTLPNNLIRIDTNNSVLDESQIKNIVFKIDWSFSNILNTHVHLSETKLADLISKHDIVHASIPFGNRSAQRLGIQPDSMIQIALQIAYYSLYGRMTFTLEPISTRGFKNSRSSFINIQNQSLLELCQLFISNSINEVGKLDKFLQTCDKHSKTVKMAKLGSGYEKHFNALKYLYKFHDHYGMEFNEDDEKIATDLFENHLIAPFSQPELIVANCGNSATTIFGITPAIPQGFGIGYIIKDDQCDLTVTSQFRQGDRLMFMLNWVLHEIRSYWKQTKNTKQNRTGVKISPLIDRLYELDNAVKDKTLNELLRSNSSSPSPSALRAVESNQSYRSGTHHKYNHHNAFRFFDIDAHIDSRSISATPPVLASNRDIPSPSDFGSRNYEASSGKLASRLAELVMDGNDGHSSSALSVPTPSEKQNTGSEIAQLHPSHTTESSDFETESPISGTDRYPNDGDFFINNLKPESRRRNVINSKFDIDFDRADVGRKVSTYE